MLSRDQQILEIILSVAKTKGLKTKTALAKAAKTTPQSINNIRNGARGMGKDLLGRFAAALGVSVESLYPLPATDHPAMGMDPATLALFNTHENTINALREVIVTMRIDHERDKNALTARIQAVDEQLTEVLRHHTDDILLAKKKISAIQRMLPHRKKAAVAGG
jgi:transcriptional regulator with XRE-family HTH domain